MIARYSAPSVDAIQEDSEEESREEFRRTDEVPLNNPSYRRHPRSSSESAMAPMKMSAAKERERSRRAHRSTPSGSKHQPKPKPTNTIVRRASGPPPRESGSDVQRIRHRRNLSNRSTSSTSSSDEGEPVQDHRAALEAARLRLTSPSMISTATFLTTATNKSSGSSGSNSTVTQASVTKRSSLGKRPEMLDPPMSPAAPDPPDVFAFLETESTARDATQHEVEEERDDNEEPESQWQSNELERSYNPSALPPHLSRNRSSASASTSSSFHGSDQFSEPAADNDTDRSTSPERSVDDHTSDHEPEPEPSTDRASAKIAAQMAAAQQRQSLHISRHSFGTPDMERGNAVLPHIPPTGLTPRYVQNVKPPSLPRAEKIPVTGYELLASRLSSYSSSSEKENGPLIKPIYRKFGALNHRLLLHLQDEISELEEQLHRLDNADTQSRRAGVGGRVVPASRRAAAMQGGELQWHKTDVLGRIGFKLAQYNQALSSFNTTQSLFPPDPRDVTTYREYLHTEHPIAAAETRFLDPADDLVSICSSIPPSAAPTQSQALSRSHVELQFNFSNIPSLATAIAVAFLVPILTFIVIPGFIGRMTVAGLVAGGLVGVLTQAGVIGRGCFGREGLACWGIYGGVMIVVAGIMS